MDVRQLLEAVRAGTTSPVEAESWLAREADLGFAVLDHHRAARTGLGEVVYGEGKTAEQLVALLRNLRARSGKALATRVDAEKAARVQQALPDAVYEAVPRLLYAGDDPFAATVPGRVCVVCAGTSDLPVAEEAARCAEWFGLTVDRANDVGVAGLHRLLARLESVRKADVVIAVAGMEGALPSVVGGLVRAPVIAVPTSIGYGANLGGLTALLAIVNACSGGVAAVNIDNGFGAAQVAYRILASRGSSSGSP
jgi:NCAIR mutase (PurE)-related protein